MSDCIFCKIANGEIPTDMVYEDELVVAFKDMAPQAPVHVLVVPKAHIKDMNALDAGDTDLLSALTLACQKVAESQEVAEGYRLVTNIGEDGGQSVAHLHFHLLGGRALQWPPG